MPLPTARWAAIKALFDAVVELPPHQREPLITAAALEAIDLAELQSLLSHHDAFNRIQGFLAESAVDTLAAHSPSRTGQRMGAWEIVRPIGAGGMGEVFEARRADGSFDGRAAVKLLKRGMDSVAVLHRFAQERQALARLSHPNIARLLDAGASADGLPYFVMEYVDGQSIDQASCGLSVEARLLLFLQLADAVASAHRNLLVHRDLKPGNVLVDQDGQVKLLDFGIAKALDSLEGQDGQLTAGGQRPFTPNYASPEQVRGEPVSTATDIYSLGVLLYQMLTGTRPTGRNATTPAEVARSVLEDTPTKPSRLSASEVLDPNWLQNRKALEGDLDNVLLKSLEKSSDRRYPSVESMATDVRAYLGGYAVSARTPSAGYVLSKFVKRNRWAVAIVGICFVAVLLGIFTALNQRNRAELRYTQVRAIANSYIFKYNDAIESLPGSLSVRRELLDDALKFLDELSADSVNDPAIAVEQAAGYRKVALARYNGRNLPNVGDRAGALVASNKARALLEFALHELPQDAGALTQLAQLEADEAALLSQEGQLDASIAKFDSAISRLEHVTRANPTNGPAGFELSYCLMSAALVQSKKGLPATDYLARATTAFDRWTAQRPDHPDVMTLRQLLLSRKFMNAFANKDLLAAVQFAEEEISLYEDNLRINPDNFLYRRSLQTALNNQGAVLHQLARYTEALSVLERGLDAGKTLLFLDAQSVDGRTTLARTYFNHGKAQFAITNQVAAKSDFMQSEATFSALGIKNVTPLYIRQRGENLFWLAKTCHQLRHGSCLQHASSGLRSLAREHPQVFAKAPAEQWLTEINVWTGK